jgi:hypothetical protein
LYSNLLSDFLLGLAFKMYAQSNPGGMVFIILYQDAVACDLFVAPHILAMVNILMRVNRATHATVVEKLSTSIVHAIAV